MSTVTPQALLTRLYRYFWSLIVTLLILAAVLFTVVRLSLPYATAYRAEAEQSLSKTLGQKVTIQSMTAELIGIRPSLVLKNVTVYGASGKRQMFHIASLVVGFSISKSLVDKHAIPVSLNLTGAQLDITHDRNGKYQINGVPLRFQADEAGVQQMPQFQPVLQWLFQHGRLALEQVGLSYKDELSGLDLRFDNMNLRLKNSGSRHQVDGVAQLPASWGKTAGFSIDMQADSLRDSSQWKVSTYIVAQELQLAEITKTFPIDGGVIQHGVGNVQLWSDWQGNRPESFEANLSLLNFAYLPSHEANHVFSLGTLSARVIAKQKSQGVWDLDVPRLQIDSQDSSREPMRLALQVDNNTGAVDARANLVYLQDLQHLLVASGENKAAWMSALSGMAPKGELRDLHLYYRPGEPQPDYKLAFRMVDVSTLAWKKFPRVNNLSGMLWMDPDSGVVEVDSHDMVVGLPKVFRQPWAINSLKGELQWRKLGDAWHVQTRRLDIDGADADMAIRMQLMLPQGRPGYLDLLARFDNADLSQLPRYYPVNIMEPDLVKWLDNAILSGQGQQGGILYHGSLKPGVFPYHRHQGKFEVAFEGRDIGLAYLKGWPALTHMNGQLLFDGPGMRIEANAGSIEDMQVTAFSARIRDFRSPWLRIKGKVQGGSGNALAFIAHSPLREHVDKVIDRLHASGRTELDLSMTIPLNTRLGVLRYQGKLDFADSRISSQLGHGQLLADDVNGRLSFSQLGYTARDIQAKVFQRPARIYVSTQQEGEDRMVELMVRGRAPSAVLDSELKVDTLRYLKGETDFTARLQMISGSHDETRLLVDSQLQGMSIELPQPLGKPASQNEEMEVHWDLAHGDLGLSLGQKFQAALALRDEGEETALSRADLHFGNGEARLPDQDVLRLSGSLPQFPLTAWTRTLAGNGKGSGSSQDISGKLPLQLRFDYVNVIAEEKPAGVEHMLGGEQRNDPKQIDADIQKLVYKGINLGHMTLAADAISSGYRINVLSLDGPVMGLSSNGYWYQGNNPETALNFSFQAHSTEDLLSTFDFKTPIRGGDLSAHGDVQWPGSPADFKLASLEGKASYNMTDGRLEDIDPGAGRVWGLFSFQALPRRLFLDFRDLFGKGYRFDAIHGDIQVHNGNAYTHNTEISSPAARVHISGRTGLISHDYDQDVIVIPGDGSNVFVAGALAGGLQTGVVAWLIEKLFNVEKYSRYIYKITGTWEHPIVTNLSDKAAAAAKAGKR